MVAAGAEKKDLALTASGGTSISRCVRYSRIFQQPFGYRQPGRRPAKKASLPALAAWKWRNCGDASVSRDA